MNERALSGWQAFGLDDTRLKQLSLALVIAVFLTLLLMPMLRAGPAPLTSDESLYLAESYNIAQGVGPAYPSGELINHRAPLFPAISAIPIRLSGGDARAAYAFPKLIVIALVAATFLIARQAFGTGAGVIAGLLAGSSAYLRWLGTTLFLDGAETLFMLLALGALMRAFREESPAWFSIAGALLGGAFLMKEVALLWLPLPVVVALLSSEYRTRRTTYGIVAYLAVASAAMGGWWLWVYAATERVYLWGEPTVALLIVTLVAIATLALAAIGCVATQRRVPDRLPALARWYGTALAIAWLAGSFALLENAGAWPYARDYVTSVPDYLWSTAAPNTQPWPLVAAGIAWLAWRARTDANARLLALGFALFLPFGLHAANRGLSYRDLLPLVYLAYIAAGGLAALLLERAAQHAREAAIAAAVTGIAAFGLMQTLDLKNDWLPYERAAVTEANWDNPLVHDTARWVHDNVPAGAAIMSSRLYYSQLYVLDEAAHPVFQLPTVRVEARPGETPFLEPVSTLFRWEDDRLAVPKSDDWLYVRRYPIKGYYVALGQHDLLRDIEERGIDFVVISGEDAGFSSLSYLDYFEANPAFSLVYATRRDDQNAVYIFLVERRRLTSQPYETVVDGGTLDALSRATGLTRDDVARAIDPDGVRTAP